MTDEENLTYPSLLWKFVDEERKRKIKRFYSLLAQGKEFFYDFFQDVLYADLNSTLTESHLAMRMLEYLDQDIANKAKAIMKNQEVSKRSRILSIAKLLKGKTVDELIEASTKASKEVKISEYIVNDLKNLKPTKLVIFTDTDRFTAETYREIQLNLIYNSYGEFTPIRVYATELVHEGGILTGEVNYIPDELERHKIQNLEHLKFLIKHMELIA